MKVAIIGTGALASLFASRLWAASPDLVVFGNWQARIDAVNLHGLQIQEENGSHSTTHPKYSQFNNLHTFDLLIVLVKSYQTQHAAEQIAKFQLLSPNSNILTLQNGMGNLELLQQAFPHHNILAGSTTQAALNLNDHTVKNTGNGQVLLGKTSNIQVGTLQELFARSGFHSEIHENIETVLWMKLLVNCSINILTALTGVRNGKVGEHPVLRKYMFQLADEGLKVAVKLNILLPAHFNHEYLLEVTRNSKENQSSTLVDVLHHRQTELDAMNGYLLKQAAAVGVECPLNKRLMELYHKQPKEFVPSMEMLDQIDSD